MNLFEEAALMGRLQIDFAKQFAQAPKPMTREELEEREQDPEYRAERSEHEKDCQHDR